MGRKCEIQTSRAIRRLLKKTDMQSSDVLMAVEINDADLLHTVNTLLNDETAEEEKPWSEAVQRM